MRPLIFLLAALAGAAPRRAVPVTAAYFCRAGRVELLDAAQRLSDQLAEAVPGFAQARQATLVPEIHVGNVQVHTGDGTAQRQTHGVGHIDAASGLVLALVLFTAIAAWGAWCLRRWSRDRSAGGERG